MDIRKTGRRPAAVLLFFFLLLTGLAGEEGLAPDSGEAGTPQRKSFGSYVLPEGWAEAKPWTRGEKYFYVKRGAQLGRTTTNISVELGNNRYPLSEHMTFRYAILQQMLMQARGAQVGGAGTFTDRDYPLYIFTIEDENERPRVKTVQFYIIGEKKHILVHLTDFYNSGLEDAEEIARAIADSFLWPD